MKLQAHVGPNGKIVGLVASPEGKPSLMLTPSPGVQICEIEGHSIKGETVEVDQLVKLLETHTVAVTPIQGKFVRRKK
jgi:hypothetical protein